MNTFGKKGIVVIAAILFLSLLSSCASHGENKDKEDVQIDSSNSYYLDFEVKDEAVIIRCHYVIENNTGRNQSVQLLGDFRKDQQLGLIKESQLTATNAVEDGNSIFNLVLGKNILDVYFVGTFGGVKKKADRLLPDTDVLLLSQGTQGTVPCDD